MTRIIFSIVNDCANTRVFLSLITNSLQYSSIIHYAFIIYFLILFYWMSFGVRVLVVPPRCGVGISLARKHEEKLNMTVDIQRNLLRRKY